MGEPDGAGETVPAAATSAVAGSSGIDGIVDAQLARLADLPLAEHPDVYQEIHTGLRASLTEIDDA